jgi:23S rRNA pseudouridine2604 synthase
MVTIKLKKDSAAAPTVRSPVRSMGLAPKRRATCNQTPVPAIDPTPPQPVARHTPASAQPSLKPDRAQFERHYRAVQPSPTVLPRSHDAQRASATPTPTPTPDMRLSKRMSELGIASRREADEWIPKGWVRVDGRVVSTLGSRVTTEQHITLDAKARNQQAARVTVLINKPVGYVSGQAEDGHEPAWVLVTPQNQWREDPSGIAFVRGHLQHLVPAGRLDIDSVGLLALTQDGRIAKQLVGEDSDIEKEYLVRVHTQNNLPLPDEALALLNHGLELDGQPLQSAQVEWVNDDQLRFILREGKKRQIRRMCEAVGLDVLGLKRVRIGQVMLGNLPPGQWRYLRLGEQF